MTILTNMFITPQARRMPRSAQALQLIGEFTAMMAYAAYLVAVLGTSAPANVFNSFTAIITAAVLCSTIFVAAHRTQLRPALWGIGYALGFVMATMAGQMYFDDSFFLGMVYTLIGSAFVAVFGGLVPLEQWIAKKYPAAA